MEISWGPRKPKGTHVERPRVKGPRPPAGGQHRLSHGRDSEPLDKASPGLQVTPKPPCLLAEPRTLWDKPQRPRAYILDATEFEGS